MTDKEVGELWQRDGWDVASPVHGLIIKLVEVTAHEITEINDDCIGRRGLKSALAKYGIPEESWPGGVSNG